MSIKSLKELLPVKKYLDRIGAEADKLLHATIKVPVGKYFKEIGYVKFTKEGDVEVNPTGAGYDPTPEEIDNMRHALKNADWPIYRYIKEGEPWPAAAAEASPNDVFEFRDESNNIVMLQVRIERKGERSYVPYTQYTDNVWRSLHPEGNFPLWGMENIRRGCTVIISEGAKSARRMQRMIEQKTKEDKELYARHPWALELDNAVHIGFIGGAYATSKTDWGKLRTLGVERVYIVADNDKAGRSAVPKISKALDLPCWWIQFTSDFPVSFDLGDDFPASMFKKIKGGSYYIGPSFDDLLQFGTWGTDMYPDPEDEKGRRMIVSLRDSFRDEWIYLDNQALFVCQRKPEMIYDEKKFNNFCLGWSDTSDMAKKILQKRVSTISRQTYRPDNPGLIVNDDGVPALNMFRPSKIKAQMGDVTPFLEFLAYLIPDEKERHQVMRWCATLIARPEVRMRYALLMITENQGIGKSTLGESILMPLIGASNCSKPSTDQLEDKFNGYAAMKRLAIVDELYSGKRGYNNTKSLIADDYISLRKLYNDPIDIKNWITVYATSNTTGALKVEEDDRRWLIPYLNEEPWPKHKFDEFNDWLNSGGLSIVKFWAEQFGDYVSTGERAPRSKLKSEIVEEGRPPAARETYRLAQVAIEKEIKCAFTAIGVEEWINHEKGIQHRLSTHELLKAMREAGMKKSRWRISVGGVFQYLIMTPALWEVVKDMKEPEQKTEVKEWIWPPSRVLEAEM